MENNDEINSKKKFNLLSDFNILTKIKDIKFFKKETNNNNKSSNKKKNYIFKKKRYIYILITVIILIILFLVSIFYYINNLKYKPYIKYEEKMVTYGFDTLYNNKSAKTSELVTKAEALKLAIAAVYNTDDISDFATVSDEYMDATWVDYAKAAGITNEDINQSNYNNKVKYIDVIEYFENCKIKLLEQQSSSTAQSNIKDITKYTVAQQAAINDLVTDEIIIMISNSINGNENIFKGKLNELIVNFVQNYNTITMPGEKININPEKVPSNANEYPYTLASVDKSIYEKAFNTEYIDEAMSPIILFKYKKESYAQIQRFAEEYFNIILNVDYTTIDEDTFKTKLAQYLIYKPNDYAISKYIENVKTNEIITQGSAKVQFPVIYSDGISYRIRMKVTFEIKSSKTKDNLIYLDYIDGLSKTYEKNKYDLIIDYYMTNAIGDSDIYLREEDLYESIIDKEASGIIQEVDTEVYFKEGQDAKY